MKTAINLLGAIALGVSLIWLYSLEAMIGAFCVLWFITEQRGDKQREETP